MGKSKDKKSKNKDKKSKKDKAHKRPGKSKSGKSKSGKSKSAKQGKASASKSAKLGKVSASKGAKAQARITGRQPSSLAEAMPTLTIDIGGTGTKMVPLDAAGNAVTKRMRELTPRPAHPEPVLEVIRGLVAKVEHPFERVSVGFPGVVIRGVVHTAPNLDTEAWRGFDMQSAIAEITGKPTRVINDADLQGYGVITGVGVELALTLGTGLGSALYSDGHLVPNLEWGHHPFGDGKTYEERINDEVAESVPIEEFRARVKAMLEQMQPILNYERLYIGGGNAKLLDLKDLPGQVEIFKNVEGMEGGMRLWADTYE
jgi:polyphosphate glucokinase